MVEENLDAAKEIAGEFESVRVINGSASEADILTECGIEAADAFIATSGDDNANLVSSVLAKKMGAKSTIVTSQQQDFMSLIGVLDIDANINPYFLAVERILRLARGRGVYSVTKFFEGDMEALELIPEEGSAVTKTILGNIKFPQGAIVGAVYGDKNVFLAKGDTRIEAGKRVIVFCQKDAVKKLQALFTRG
ncbi:MAG: NAD-binding protein [Candidatus Omnitrophica bacterium]|nr:NAD-binding protein [Candidatus Omnitrophota bacterium]